MAVPRYWHWWAYSAVNWKERRMTMVWPAGEMQNLPGCQGSYPSCISSALMFSQCVLCSQPGTERIAWFPLQEVKTDLCHSCNMKNFPDKWAILPHFCLLESWSKDLSRFCQSSVAHVSHFTTVIKGFWLQDYKKNHTVLQIWPRFFEEDV